MVSDDGVITPGAAPAWSEFASIGVTGTNGKTTTTQQSAFILARSLRRPVFRATTVGYFLDDRELAVDTSYEGFVAAQAVAAESGCRHAVLEMTSEALSRGFAQAWPCQVGVFTNLTHDHQDAHPNAEHYLASKAQLMVNLPAHGAGVLNAQDSASVLLAEVIPTGVRALGYAVADADRPLVMPAGLMARDLAVSPRGTRATLLASAELGLASDVALDLRGVGAPFVENALAALLATYALGVALETGAAALRDAPVPPGRFELVSAEPMVVVDYAHTPDAIFRTIQTALRLAPDVTAVFGAGGDRDRIKRPLMGWAARHATRVILTTDNPRSEDPARIGEEIAAGMDAARRPEVILDRKTAIRTAIGEVPLGGIVLLLGKGHERTPFSDVEFARACVGDD